MKLVKIPFLGNGATSNTGGLHAVDPRDMPKFVTKDTMCKQFRVFIVPSDIQSILDQLRSKVGLRVIEETAPDRHRAQDLLLDSIWGK